MPQHIETFPCMGGTLRVVIGPPSSGSMPAPAAAAAAVRAWLEAYDRRLSRFRSDSETSRLNDDQRRCVPASALMRSLVGAAIWAAERSGGLVDPTLAEELERSGYDHSRAGAPCAPVAAALAVAPRRRVAAAEPDARWRTFHVDNERRVVERPPGVVFDPGAVGKALAADAVADRLHDYTRFVIDCDGDLRLGGTAAEWKRYFVRLRNPLSGRIGYVLEVTHGAVATSSLRPWHRNANGFTHALLDPATGAPAWTGIVSATAIAPTTLEADTLAKTAFLSGPAGARKVLGTYGGVTIDEAGRVELHAL